MFEKRFNLRLILGFLSLFVQTTLFAQTDGVMINYGAGTREPSAILDLRSTNQGFLAPKVNISDLGFAAPVTSPAEGLIVYNENATTGKGYYFWDGARWMRLMSGNTTPVSGSGTVNYLSKWTPNGANLGNSQIFDNGTNVGIGTASPAALLHLQSTNISDIPQGEIVVSRYWNSNTNTRASSIFHYFNSSTGIDNLAFAVSGDGGSYNQPNQLSQIKMTIQANGNVGVGTTVPDDIMHIYNPTAQGNSAIGGIPANNEAATLILEQRHSSSRNLEGVTDAGFTAPMIDFRAYNGADRWSVGQVTGLVDAGPSGYAGGLAFSTSPGGTTNPADSRTNGSDLPIRMLIQGDGDVGVNTVSPTQKLDVNGQIRMRTGANSGYIPVSSADGTMTWTDPATITASDNDWAKVGGGTPTLTDEIYHSGNVGIGLTDPSSVLHISTTQTGNVSKLHNPTLANGSLVGHEFGKTNSNNNMVEFRYNHVSDGSTDNYVNLGLWGNANSLVVQGSGNVGIGSSAPNQKLLIGQNGGIGFGGTGLNSADKKLYSPADGDLEWMTHSGAAVHGFAISHQGTKQVYLNIAGDSYLNGGNVGIGLTNPTFKLHVNGDIHPDGKFVVQDGVNGGNSRGIWMWTAGDPNWGIYMGQSGATRALDGGTAVAGGGFNSHAIRFRSYNSSSNGFVFENSSNQMLMSIRSDNGRTTFKGSVLFDCPDCGSTTTVDGNSDWGDMIIQGRVLSSNSNLHLSPPGGSGVIINSTYRAAGGGTGQTYLDVDGRTDTRGLRTERHIRFYKRSRGNGQGGTDNLGNYDFCYLAGVAFRNTDSYQDEDDDYQCNVFSSDIHGSADYNEGENEDFSANFSYTSRPYWKMYSECYQDCSNSTCTAMCINFDY